MTIKLLVGLGNPGSEYYETRHNAGFLLLDKILEECGGTWRKEKKFKTLAAMVSYKNQPIVLLKPQTFMNRSGDTVGAWCRFFKIAPSEVMVIHDDIDTPWGKVKLREGGGHGGHNGIRDLIEKMGRDFYRVKLGVGRPKNSTTVVSNFVVGRFEHDELAYLREQMYFALLERIDSVQVKSK